MNVGDKATTTFDIGDTARIRLVQIMNYSATGMPSDYLFEYLEEETNRKIEHPGAEGMPELKGKLLLPEGLLHQVVKFDSDVEKEKENDEYQITIDTFINGFSGNNQASARLILEEIERLKGKEEVLKSIKKHED